MLLFPPGWTWKTISLKISNGACYEFGILFDLVLGMRLIWSVMFVSNISFFLF